MPNEDTIMSASVDDQTEMSCERGMRLETINEKKKEKEQRCMGAVMTKVIDENML